MSPVNNRTQLFGVSLSESLIGIKDEDPITLSILNTFVSSLAKASRPRRVEDLSTHRPGNLNRVVI